MPASESALFRILRGNRSEFNGRFERARRAYPRLTGEAFLAHCTETLAPLVEAIERSAPDAVPSVTQFLYDVSLQLVGEDRLGPNARWPEIRQCWQRLMPAYAKLLAAEPLPVTRILTNGVESLVRAGARADEWMRRLAESVSLIDSREALERTGQVAAWLAGMAHLRDPALRIASQLSDPILCSLFAQPSGTASRAALKLLKAHRWRTLEGVARDGAAEPAQLAIQRRFGAFRGFGGVFLNPPMVIAENGMLFASDSERSWAIAADSFGVTLHQCRERVDCSVSKRAIAPNGAVSHSGLEARFLELMSSSSSAALEDTIAVTLPSSHSIALIGAA